MRNGTRLLLAAATGAAVFASGTASAFATQSTPFTATAAACDLTAADVTGIKFEDAYIPLKENLTVGFEATIKDPYKLVNGTGDLSDKKVLAKDVTSVKAEFQRVGETTWNDATIEQVANPPGGAQTAAPADVKIKGGFKVTKDNKDGKWLVRLTVTRDTAKESCKEVDVDPQVKYLGSSVTDPVVVTRNEDTKVVVKAGVIGASSVSARLFSNDATDSVDLQLEKGNTANSWYSTTWFDSDFSTGDWTLELTAGRGKESAKYEKADTFTVRAGKSTSRKRSSKVSFDVTANKIKKGTSIRLFGTAYRGSSAYSGKMVELYCKKRGASGWKFVSFAKANGSGRFGKVVRPKFDAYWRAVLPGTGKTYGSKSGVEFVDVR